MDEKPTDQPIEPKPQEGLREKIEKVFDEFINPGVAMHGGHISLLDVKDNKVYVQLSGGCQGCGMADVTLKQGIEATLREEISPDLELIDTTDHAGGNNPFYSPGK